MSQGDTPKTDDNNVSQEDTVKTDKSSSSGKVSVEIKTKYIVYTVLILVLIMAFALSLRYVEMPSSADDEQTAVDIAVVDDSADISTVDVIHEDLATPELPAVVDDTVAAYVPEAGEIVISLDETASTDVLDVKLNSYEVVSSYVYQTEEDGTERTDIAIGGKEFLMANFTVVNKGTISVYVGYGKATLLSGDIYTYEPIVYEGYEGLPKYEKISPGTEMSGIVVFEIPSNSEDVRIRYSFSGLSISERFVTWFL